MCQPEACSELAKYAKSLNMNIWCYTGYTYEQLITLSKSNKYIMEFLENIDVLVDGKFMLELKSDTALFRGSTNQRIIDVKSSLQKKRVCLVEKYKEKEEEQVKFCHEKYLFV